MNGWSGMYMNGQDGQEWAGMETGMDRDGQEWSGMDRNGQGQGCTGMGRDGQGWTLDRDGQVWKSLICTSTSLAKLIVFAPSPPPPQEI
jgi:hypothetical protein